MFSREKMVQMMNENSEMMEEPMQKNDENNSDMKGR